MPFQEQEQIYLLGILLYLSYRSLYLQHPAHVTTITPHSQPANKQQAPTEETNIQASQETLCMYTCTSYLATSVISTRQPVG